MTKTTRNLTETVVKAPAGGCCDHGPKQHIGRGCRQCTCSTPRTPALPPTQAEARPQGAPAAPHRVRFTVTIDVDRAEWASEFGTDASPYVVDQDVRAYILNAIKNGSGGFEFMTVNP